MRAAFAQEKGALACSCPPPTPPPLNCLAAPPPQKLARQLVQDLRSAGFQVPLAQLGFCVPCSRERCCVLPPYTFSVKWGGDSAKKAMAPRPALSSYRQYVSACARPQSSCAPSPQTPPLFLWCFCESADRPLSPLASVYRCSMRSSRRAARR